MRSQSVFFVTSCVLTILASCTKDPENKAPVANAGASTSTTLPADSVRLNGTGTDADGRVAAYVWSQVSGPANSTIVNPGAPSTSVKGLKQGSYVFQLLVTDDKGATGVDTMTVLVNPAQILTVTLQPTDNPTEVTLVNYNGQDQTGWGAPDVAIEAWTKNGFPYTFRELLKFDLSGIPATANIMSANLTLYTYPPPVLSGNFADANFGTNNAFFIQQAASNWSRSTVTWFNQPAGITTNQVTVPAVGQTPQDVSVDVTGLVSSMVNNNNNYGFLLKLVSETVYNSRLFVSSFSTTYATKHPKLVITYQ